MTLFFLGLALAASPGPDFLMIKHTLGSGTRSGYATLLGNRTSFLLHLTLATLGLSVLLQKSAFLYLILRLAGAAYLLYLGISGFWRGAAVSAGSHDKQQEPVLSFKTAYLRGFWSNLLNPKVSLFFMSIFPQFLSIEQLGHQPFLPAIVFLAGNSLWYICILPIIGATSLKRGLARYQRWFEFVFSFLFIAFGVRMMAKDVLLLLNLCSLPM